jgi:hypothetical protein
MNLPQMKINGVADGISLMTTTCGSDSANYWRKQNVETTRNSLSIALACEGRGEEMEDDILDFLIQNIVFH